MRYSVVSKNVVNFHNVDLSSPDAPVATTKHLTVVQRSIISRL